MKLYFRILQFMRPHRSVLAFAVIAMIFSAFFDSVSLGVLVPLSDNVLGRQDIVFPRALPPFLEEIIAKFNAMPELTLLNFIVAALMVIFVLKGIFFFIRTYLLTKLSHLVIRDIRNALYRKIQNFSLDYFSHSITGHLVSRITYDVDVLKAAIAVGLTDLVYQLLSLVFFSLIIFYINWKWALICLVIIPLVAFPIYRLGRMIKKISGQAQEKMAELNRRLFETISGVRIVKAFSREETEIGKVEEQNYGFYRIMMRLQKRAIMLGPFTEFIGACGGALVLYYGGREVIAGRMSLGVFVVFLGALLASIKPLRRLSEVHGINQQALAAAKRIFEVLDTPVKVIEDKGAAELGAFEKEIVFENVSFGYDDKLVLKDINLTVTKGEIVALVGPSGMGKSTLINLIPRFYDPVKGAVKIDGVDLRDVTFKSLRRQIGIVTQDIFLFHDTVRNNIAYGKEDARDGEVVKAAETAEAHEFIMELPKGYDTVIGDMGTKLSGGQKQRLALARAILNNPPILILDEATSQLDAESTRLVQDALDYLMENRTALVIAHRLATVQKASRIIVIDEGGIVEQGTHAELMRMDGLYKRLFEMEFIS